MAKFTAPLQRMSNERLLQKTAALAGRLPMAKFTALPPKMSSEKLLKKMVPLAGSSPMVRFTVPAAVPAIILQAVHVFAALWRKRNVRLFLLNQVLTIVR